MMFTLQTITVEGFRGFPKQARFDLGEPLIMILGPNGTGKSSLACAIEWCIFGQDVETESHTGIRERISWQARNHKASQCLVEMELTDGHETLVVHRSAPKIGKPDFWFRLGSRAADDDAGKLKVLLGGLEIKDFFTAVHLHQESLRGLLLAQPGERKEDFYRLLGLVSLLNQTKAIADANLDSLLQNTDRDFERFEEALVARVYTRQTDLRRAREEAFKQGLSDPDLSREGISKVWQGLISSAKSFCETYSLLDCELLVSVLESNAVPNAKRELQRLRSSCPILKGRGEVLARINTLTGLQDSYQKADKELNRAKQEIKKLPPEERELPKLTEEIGKLEKELKKAKDKRSEASAKAAVLSEAIEYFDKLGLSGTAKCPVCEKPVESVEGIRTHYDEEIRKGLLGPLEERISQLQTKLKKAKDAKAILEDLEGEVARKEKVLAARKVEIASALGKTLGSTDDPVAFLVRELKELNQRREELEKQVPQVEESLEAIDRSIDKVTTILAVLRYEGELSELSKLAKTEAFQHVEASRLQIEDFVCAVEILSHSLTRELEEAAEKRLGSVRDGIAKTFEALTGRSDFPRLSVSPDTKFAAQVEGGAGVADALSVLNQADANCAALSIFLALAGARSISHRLGFLILDDPNQTLDKAHSSRLAEVLSDLSKSRQLLLCTIDETLCSTLQKRATKKKMVYRFKTWDPRNGPHIETR